MNDTVAKSLLDKAVNPTWNGDIPTDPKRKRIVVVGLGMVGIAFM
jgi:hypothetical protein